MVLQRTVSQLFLLSIVCTCLNAAESLPSVTAPAATACRHRRGSTAGFSCARPLVRDFGRANKIPQPSPDVGGVQGGAVTGGLGFRSPGIREER